jgi:hypothetical protein
VLPLDFDAYFGPSSIGAAELFAVDDTGQFAYYRSLGHFRDWPSPEGTVGEAHDPRSRVVCCNLGVAALDAIFAATVFDTACERGVGTPLPR